jgi:hypothetical protein
MLTVPVHTVRTGHVSPYDDTWQVRTGDVAAPGDDTWQVHTKTRGRSVQDTWQPQAVTRVRLIWHFRRAVGPIPK